MTSKIAARTALASMAIALNCTVALAAEPVTVDNFIRAESDLYFSNMVKDGALSAFVHRREPADVDNQTVIRLNRDTLYSSVVIDLDAGPATVTLPDAGTRFMSLMVINQDHYISTVSYKGATTLTKGGGRNPLCRGRHPHIRRPRQRR